MFFQVFFCQFCKIFKNTYFKEQLRTAIFEDLKVWRCDTRVTDKKNRGSSSFVDVLFSNSNEPIYFIKIEEKSVTEHELRDQFGHVVFKGECN